jgi:hypothetical protein
MVGRDTVSHIGIFNPCSALLRAKFCIEPPPDTQKTERQG